MISRMLQMVKRFIVNPQIRFGYLTRLGLYNNWPDDRFLEKKYEIIIGEKLDLQNPRSFNEKIQWLKLYDRQEHYTTLVDKYAVKDHVAHIIGEKYIVPTIGIWDHFKEIDFESLPNQFVLKCTHDCGGLVICKDKSQFDKKMAKRKIEGCLKVNYYYIGREWPYKNVPPRILCEQYLECDEELKDYKFLCFNGEVKCSFICSDRYTGKGLHVTFFDREWNVMPFERHYPYVASGFPKPQKYEKMVELAERLAVGIPFVRVDFYEVSGKIYFGEMTFYPGGGVEEFTPKEWDYILGSWIKLPER